MTLTPGDDLNETSRQRTRDQFGLLREAHGTGIIVDTDDPADFNFICSSEEVLVNRRHPGADPDRVPPTRSTGSASDSATSRRLRQRPTPRQAREGLFTRFTLPTGFGRLRAGEDPARHPRRDRRRPGVRAGFARPDHLVHICGKGSDLPSHRAYGDRSHGSVAAPDPRRPERRRRRQCGRHRHRLRRPGERSGRAGSPALAVARQQPRGHRRPRAEWPP